MADRMSEKEVQQLVNRAVRAGETRWSDFEESFREMLSTGFEIVDILENGEFDEIKAVVGDLERQLFALGRPYTPD